MRNALLDFVVHVGVIVTRLWMMIAISLAKGVSRWLMGNFRRAGRLIGRWSIAGFRFVLIRLHYAIGEGVGRLGAWIANLLQAERVGENRPPNDLPKGCSVPYSDPCSEEGSKLRPDGGN